MKKIIPVILAVLLVVGMCTVSVSAFTIGGDAGYPEGTAPSPIGTSQSDVTISAEGNTVHVYAVNITFGNMTFTYGTATKWNPDTHKYDVVEGGEAVWTATGTPDIVIENHSDLPIKYDIAASDENQAKYGAKVQFNDQDTVFGTIDRCPVDAVDAPSAKVTVSVVTDTEGTVQNITTTAVKLATITVTITKSA